MSLIVLSKTFGQKLLNQKWCQLGQTRLEKKPTKLFNCDLRLYISDMTRVWVSFARKLVSESTDDSVPPMPFTLGTDKHDKKEMINYYDLMIPASLFLCGNCQIPQITFYL